MTPVISIIGKSDSGKTTLLEKLIPELSRLGHKVGTIKHHHRGDFEIDIQGKDSWRHRQAGASATAISSQTGLGFHKNTEADISVAELTNRYFSDCDIVLTEGYKQAPFPKIEVFRKEAHSCSLAEEGITVDAMVTDSPLNIQASLFSFNQVDQLARFIVNNYMVGQQPQNEISLDVNGKPIDLNRFASSFLANSISGMITSLRGCEKPHTIKLSIKIPDQEQGE